MKRPAQQRKPLHHVSLANNDGQQSRLRSGDILVVDPKQQTIRVVREGQPLVWIEDFLGGRDDKRSFSLVRSREQATELAAIIGALSGIVLSYYPSDGDYRFKVL